MSTVDLEAISESVPLPDDDARAEATLRQGRLTTPAGALGRLEELSIWLAGVQGACPPRSIDRARVVIFAGDHGVATSGVSAYPPEVTAQMVRNFVAGGAAVNVLARTAGASVRVLDIAVVAPRNALDWARLAGRVLGRRDVPDQRLERFLGKRQDPREVSTPPACLLVALKQAIDGVLMDRLQHPIARRPLVLIGEDEVLVRQGCEQADGVRPLDSVSRADVLGSRQCPPTGEDRRSTQHRLLEIGEQVVAPVNRRP